MTSQPSPDTHVAVADGSNDEDAPIRAVPAVGPTSRVTPLTGTEHELCLERLIAYHLQLEEANRRSDANSMSRAADVMVLYEDGRWVEESPPLKQRSNRGRPVEANSWPRFVRWLCECTGLATSTVYGLRQAHKIATIYLRQAEITPPGERALRPLGVFMKEHPEAIREIWDDAVDACGGEVPDSTVVKRAAKRWKEDNLPRSSLSQQAHRRMARDCRRRIVADLRMLIDGNHSAELWATLDEVEQLTADLVRPE